MILKMESFEMRKEYIHENGMNLQIISVIKIQQILANNDPTNVVVLICKKIRNGISKNCIIIANEYEKKYIIILLIKVSLYKIQINRNKPIRLIK